MAVGDGAQPLLQRQMTWAPKMVPKLSWLAFGGAGISGPIVIIHLMAGAFLWKHLELSEDVESFGDAFYFAVETFLTIGYGDISPASTLAKAFFIVFTLTSLVVQLTVLSTVMSSALVFAPDTVLPHTPGPGFQMTLFKVKPRIMRALQGFGLLALLLAAGALLLRWSSADAGEAIPWIDCLYWSVTTISTVGYGDIVPERRWRPVFACFFLLSVVLFAFILGESLALIADIGRYANLHAFFRRGLTEEMLAAMDCYDSDGRVQREEFLMFVLQHLGVVDSDDMERILEIFVSLDTSGDGVLDINDVRRSLSGPGSSLPHPDDAVSNTS